MGSEIQGRNSLWDLDKEQLSDCKIVHWNFFDVLGCFFLKFISSLKEENQFLTVLGLLGSISRIKYIHFGFERKKNVLKYWDISYHLHKKDWIETNHYDIKMKCFGFLFTEFAFKERSASFTHNLGKTFCKVSGLNKFILVIDIIPWIIFFSQIPFTFR